MTTAHTANTAKKSAKTSKNKVSEYSKRKVDPAFYWMTVPAAILVSIFLYWPFLQGAAYSFTNSQGYGDFKFIGLKNYIAMFQDSRVGHAYLFTILIAVLITLGTNILGMFLAVLLNSKIAFKNGFRAIFFIPYTLSVLVIGYVFKYIFMTPLPALGQALHIDWLSTSMISNPDLALVPDCVPVDLAGRCLLHTAVLGWPTDHRQRDLRGGRDRRCERLAELLADHLPADWPVLHHQHGAEPQEFARRVRPDHGIDQGRPGFQDRNRLVPDLPERLGNGEYSYQMANAVTFFIVLAILAFVQLKFFSGKEKV